jgi:excisionase family DNA binding protein
MLSDEQVEQIARRAAQLLPPAAGVSPWLNTKRAAAYIDSSPARIHDLTQAGRLHPRRDGRRLLFRADDLDAYLEEAA